jgi:hypothetical protein
MLLAGAIGMSAAEIAGLRGSPFWQLIAANASTFALELAAGRTFHFKPGLVQDLICRLMAWILTRSGLNPKRVITAWADPPEAGYRLRPWTGAPSPF